jgi:UDP-N-acetylenolpyruvoylglucosamine reductase
MSDWTAKYQDLLNLIKLAQEKVKEKFWIEIENEVRIIKN